MTPTHVPHSPTVDRRKFMATSLATAGGAMLASRRGGRSLAAVPRQSSSGRSMYGLIYFDVEDFFSPPDAPTHTLPRQLADVMHRHGLAGCFHIIGQRARFWERHGMTDVIQSIKRHDVSLHFDRGSIHPTTAEEVSQLDWFEGVDRVLFRELPGFQTLERIFGKCTALTRHGGTFAAQMIYAAGKLGKPFFHSPFRLPGRNVVWFCNNLLIGGYQAPFYFDNAYRDTAKFNTVLDKVHGYLDQRADSVDFTAMFGCHPVIAITEEFPDAINFLHGASPAPKDWVAPTLIPGVSVPLVLENFERLMKALVAHGRTKWTTVAGIHQLYGMRPARVVDAEVVRGAEQVVGQSGPQWTPTLTAGELLFLLARRVLASAPSYEVPQVMGPTQEPGAATAATLGPIEPAMVASKIVDAVMASGYLPPAVALADVSLSLESAMLLLAFHAMGRKPPANAAAQPAIDSLPGVADAVDQVKRCKDWRIHGPEYHQAGILKHFCLQCWTLKPAFTADEYDANVVLGRDLNPMFDHQ
ncbi:MAG: hypothetical protein GXY83_27560 [Rhodopirellula sp.]|nr:hypothetical protein [Rhodopirellula sp.]